MKRGVTAPVRSLWLQALKIGLIGGAASVLLALIGMVEAFSQRDIIHHVISMGRTLLLMVVVCSGAVAARQTVPVQPWRRLGNSLSAGLACGSMLALLLLLGRVVNLRGVFVNASPTLFALLSFGQATPIGMLLLAGSGAACGGLAGLLYVLPGHVRLSVGRALAWVVLIGLLQELLRTIFAGWGPLSVINTWLFAPNGLSITGSVVLFVLLATATAFRTPLCQAVQHTLQRLPPVAQRAVRLGRWGLLVGLLLALPHILGLFLSEVLTIVGLFVLMGLGLNIVVGFAGLLDLGYVAFFAIGAYTVGVLTSPELGFFHLSFWQALPVAILAAVLAGVVLGIPVLKMRGDYLAIVTLGFGEIIRVLALSDFLRPWVGGAQGIARIPRAMVGPIALSTPQHIYYLLLAGCLVAGFCSWRLKDSRLGRAWMAMREDEDVAQAMGINLVATKLLAFATGAAFSGLSGAIFASKLGSVYPHSFNLMISINILSLIIVGGMGSIPGVLVGAIALVGLPEVLREFAEYRLLVYGAALVAMMLLRPEGLWPEAVHQREYHQEGNSVPSPVDVASAPVGQQK
jgi:branched-chain amino acid transport system permease protein